MRINAPINKITYWTDKLISLGYEIISYSDLLYSEKKLEAEKYIGIFQKDCNPKNLLAVAYKGGKGLTEYFGHPSDSVARLRNVFDAIQYLDYLEYEYKEVYKIDYKKNKYSKIVCKVALIYDTNWEPVTDRYAFFQPVRIYITEQDNKREVDYIIEYREVAWIDSRRVISFIPKAKEYVMSYINQLVRNAFRLDKTKQNNPLVLLKKFWYNPKEK